ncbi:MAG: excinuclease ABC subunit UvrC [Lysobacteraceae bacterium]
MDEEEAARAPLPATPPDGFDGRASAAALSNEPGVYRMLDADGGVLYVGKAASLRKRVGSYFTRSAREPRLAAMIAQIAAIEVTVTHSEGEALILENQLIKTLRPRYNVLLRDDKSYPYIHVGAGEPFPRIGFHRGSRQAAGRYFGPYPSAGAVRETLNALHRLFRLRSCEDSVFRNRQRPCLQYQIGRCSAPCVGLIDEESYADSLRRGALFLEGKSEELQADLTAQMEAAAQALAFERAAQLRDLLANLRQVQSRNQVARDDADLDALACVIEGSQACIAVLSLRGGLNLGTRSHRPRLNGATDPAEVLAAFVTQHYLAFPPPREIILDRPIEDAGLIEEVLRERAGHRVRLRHSVRGERARYRDMARLNAAQTLSSELNNAQAQQRRMTALGELLGLPAAPQRIECFDISHTQGEATVASCVVFDAEGARRSQYRRFNIEGITPGDDYAAMRQALTRRFRRGQAEGVLPDLLLIDGGKGQLAQALAVLAELEVQGVTVVGVAKGEGRRAGHEALIRPDGSELRPGPDSAALHLVQQVRDEAHRFAITGHRGRRAKARETSSLEQIEGIGPRRRARLLKHFGGLAGLKRAAEHDIARVEGIDAGLARRVYAALHGAEE